MPQGKLPAELLLLLVMKCHGLSHTHTHAHLHDRPHRDTHTLTQRYRSISLVCNQDRRTLRAIISGQRLRSGSCQGGLQFSIDRKMNGKENVGENVRKIHLPATTFHTYFGAVLGFKCLLWFRARRDQRSETAPSCCRIKPV